MSKYHKVFQLVEQWRYQYDVGRTVQLFIEHWAYLHTGLYEPNDRLIEEEGFQSVAIPLSHELSRLMLTGEQDPLGVLLTEFCASDSKHKGFYPTPQDVSSLIGQLLNCDHRRDSDKVSIYEPCCGTGGIVLDSIEKIALGNSQLVNPLEGVTIVVEDISKVAINAFLIQFLHKLMYLSNILNKTVEPDSAGLYEVDVISRKKGGYQYVLSSTGDTVT